jgi:hypothetical protein
MKKIVLSIVAGVLFSCFASAQELPVNPSTGKVTFMEVVDAKGMKAADLYKILSDWSIAQGFVVSKKDDANNEAVFTGLIPLEYSSIKAGRNDKGKVTFTLSVFGKDGKYRYILTDFIHEGIDGAGSGGKLENLQPDCGKAGMVGGNWVYIKNKVKGQSIIWVKDLKKTVTQVQNDPAKNKDW